MHRRGDRRGGMRCLRDRAGKALQAVGREGPPRPHRARIDDRTRWREVALDSGREARPGLRGPPDLRDAQPPRREEPDGPHKRPAFPPEGVPQGAWAVRPVGPSGMAGPLRVRLEPACQPLRQGCVVHRHVSSN